MIVDCPSCNGRFRLDSTKHTGKQIRLRCPRCKNVFPVDVQPVSSEPDAGPHVLVGHSDREICSTIGEILGRENISHQICHAGDVALAMMTEQVPQVAIMDVALPGLFGFEVVEKVRSRPGLEDVKIILLSSVYNKMAYKRRPSSLYGADDYIEKHHIPDDLVAKVRNLAAGRDKTDVKAPESDEERDAWEALNERIQQAEEHETAVENGDSRMEKACRLARIIVSDIALYHQDKVEEGIRQNCFFELLADEITEGERLFSDRFEGENDLGKKLLRQAFEDLIATRKSSGEF